MALDFAANMDGRWAPTWAAFETELDRLTGLIRELAAAGVDRAPEEFSAREQFVQGMQAAARWTLGQVTRPPLWQGPPVPVCNDVIDLVATEATRVTRVMPVIRWYAEGVLAWLRWITGRSVVIVYPQP